MANPNVNETLKALKLARKKIENPENWIRKKLALDHEGNEVEPTDPNAVSFCSLGALLSAYNELGFDVPLGHICEKEMMYENDIKGHSRVLQSFDENIKFIEEKATLPGYITHYDFVGYER